MFKLENSETSLQALLYHRAFYAQLLNCVQFSVTPWTVACQAPLSKGFPRQQNWSGLPLPSPWDLPDWGIKPIFPVSPALQADSFPAEPSRKPTTPRVSPKVNYGLPANHDISVYQLQYISASSIATDIPLWWGMLIMGKLWMCGSKMCTEKHLQCPLNFAVNLKLLWKSKVLKRSF